jgi:LysM repeat protein
VSPPRRGRRGAAHYAAPIAFLLAVTVAVLLIRAGLDGGGSGTTTGTGPVTHASTTTPPGTTRATTRATRAATTTRAGSRYTVESGDTFGSISAKTGVPVAELERLNPGVDSSSLQVGQKLRVK